MESDSKPFSELDQASLHPTMPTDTGSILMRLVQPAINSKSPRRASPDQNMIQKSPLLKRVSDEHARRVILAVKEFSVAYEAVPDPLVIVDRQGTIALVNRQLEQSFGYTRDEVLGLSIEILIPERYRETHPLQRLAYFDEPHVRPMGSGMKLFGRHRDGHEFPVEISLSPVHTEAEMMVVATIRNMSAQRKIEAQIHRFEARYRTLVEGLPAVTFMATLDDDNHELYVSPQIETLLGFSQDEWLSNPSLWYAQLHSDDRARWHAEFTNSCSTGDTFDSIYRFHSRNGKTVWVHCEAKMVRDELGRPLFLQGVAFDITQAKEAEIQLRQLNQTLESRVEERTSELSAVNKSLHAEIEVRQRIESEVRRINNDLARAHEAAITANQAKSQFLANMSHELRTPLNAIIGYSELLQIQAVRRNETTYVADLIRIKKSGEHLLKLINDILDISKIESGKLTLELQTIDVAPFARDIIETAKLMALPNSNSFHANVSDGLGLILADPLKLNQCLLNLLSNACKFTQNGTVTLTVTQESQQDRNWIVFRVRDTGIGMTDEQAGRLFQPFTQADASTTRKYGGTGLGLAITKRLCEAMGGQIMMTSKAGEGSVFSIQLPADIPEN